MRTSSRKTTAAVLRAIIGGTKGPKGMKVDEWAEILGRSPHTVHDLESGRLTLSASLAAKMNYETGISIKWLMDGDPAAPPVSADGREYTKATFDQVQAGKKHFATVKDEVVMYNELEVLRAHCAILVNANRKRNFHLAVYRTAKFLDEMRNEFGEAKDFDGYDIVLEYLQLSMRSWPVLPIPKHPPKVEDLSRLPAEQPTSKPKSKRPLTKRRPR